MRENKSFDELLLPVRNDIDRIDKELLKLFTERMQCAERVAEIKRKAGIPVLNAAREQVILDRVKKEAGEYGDSAVALYSAIMSISRARQHNMLKSGGVLRDLEQNSPKTLKADPRVICQGAAGAFSHSAALRLFPGQKPIFLPGFRDVFEAVHNGAGDYGVVPVENSDAGSVSEVYDLIMKHRMFIVGAADIPVRHCLCRAKGTGAVKKVLSKHEALVQSSAYLAAHDIETEAYSNTAAAAKFIAETFLENPHYPEFQYQLHALHRHFACSGFARRRGKDQPVLLSAAHPGLAVPYAGAFRSARPEPHKNRIPPHPGAQFRV
mgnify:CR=1 FL=1